MFLYITRAVDITWNMSSCTDGSPLGNSMLSTTYSAYSSMFLKFSTFLTDAPRPNAAYSCVHSTSTGLCSGGGSRSVRCCVELRSHLSLGVQQHFVRTAGLVQPVWSPFLAAKWNNQGLHWVLLQGPLEWNSASRALVTAICSQLLVDSLCLIVVLQHCTPLPSGCVYLCVYQLENIFFYNNASIK